MIGAKNAKVLRRGISAASSGSSGRSFAAVARAGRAGAGAGAPQQQEAAAAAAAGRREALGGVVLSGAAAAVAAVSATVGPQPAVAAYGEAANVFGKAKTGASFVPYAGDGYAVLIPGKWNPSKEREWPGMDMRFEVRPRSIAPAAPRAAAGAGAPPSDRMRARPPDLGSRTPRANLRARADRLRLRADRPQDNFDAVNNMYVIVTDTKDSSIEKLGDLDNALGTFAYLLGSQSYSGKTQSEGGFQENRVSTAAVLDQKEETIKGKKYYTWEILTRTADGDEGGRHQLIKATISNGNLYVFKVQAGDKRWFKGAERECREALDSFTVV